MRTCRQCGQTLPLSEFYESQPGRSKARHTACKPCYRDYVRWSAMRSKYGIDEDTYRLLLEQQGGVCAICNRPETRKNAEFLIVDHDHETGKVRGLLCFNCNAALGHFQDSPDLLRKAAGYVEATPPELPAAIRPPHLKPLPSPDRTECGRGHQLSEANTYVTPDGRRRCRECSRAAGRLHYHRQRALLTQGA